MSAMWTWANDGTVDISEASWSPANQYDYMLWERLGENNDSIRPDPEELLQDTSTHSRKRLRHREPSFPSSKDLETTSSEIQKLRNLDSKIATEDRSAEISNSNRPPPLLVDLETISPRIEIWNAFSLIANETVLRVQNRDDASPPVSEEARCNFNVLSGKGVDDRGKDETTLTFRDRLGLPCVSPSGMEKKPYQEEDDDNRENTLKDYQWEQIGDIHDMDNFLESRDSSVGEAGVNQSYSLQWSSPLSQSTPATLISNIQTGENSPGLMRSEFNGELKLNEIASMSSLSAGALEKRTASFGDQKFFDLANSHEDPLQLPALQAEFHQPAYLANHVSPGSYDISATTVLQSNGMTFDDPRALAEIIKAQSGQALSFPGINKAQQMGGQPPNHRWSEEMIKREFPPKNMQHLSVLEIPRFGDLSLQHSLSVQQSARPLPPSSSLHEILPLPDTGASLQAACMETSSVPQVPPQFAQQLPLHFTPQCHPRLLLSNPSSRVEQIQIRQPHAGSYQYTHPALDKLQLHNEQLSGMPDTRPPLSGINMTPQEKIEKLRWRQQNQAKLLAAGQKQQQLLNLSTNVGYEGFGIRHSADDPRNAQLDQILCNKQPSRQQPLVINLDEGAARASASHFLLQGSEEVKRNHAGTGGKEPISNDIDLHSSEKATHLDAALFHQLENVIMQLDIKTRLSMRDALYRLASSARQRRAGNGSSSASGEPPSHVSRFAGTITIETPTNPIDRTIANLLFHKQSFPSPKKQVHHFSTADASLPTSPPASGDSRLWAMQSPGSAVLPNWGVPAQAFAIASTVQNVNLSRSF